jgi:N-acylneuraminate cytidylyltransferase
MNVCIIPARAGSKRIPRKNIRPFRGRPMIAWSIQAARDSGVFSRIIVSTDDAEIAALAIGLGAEAPFIRPAALADDNTGTMEVMAHAVGWMRDRDWPLDAVCCLYATAPFVRPDDLRDGRELLRTGDWSFTFTATEYASPIFRAFLQQPEGGVEMFFPEHFTSRSQDLPLALHDAGHFYWGRPEAWLTSRRLFGRASCPFFIPRWRVQDIDTEDDWRRAELLAAMLEAGGQG